MIPWMKAETQTAPPARLQQRYGSPPLNIVFFRSDILRGVEAIFFSIFQKIHF